MRSIIYCFILLFGFSDQTFAHLFLDQKLVTSKGSYKYFDSAVLGNQMAYILIDKNNQLSYLYSSDMGGHFSKPLPLKIKAMQAAMAISDRDLFVFWSDPASRKAGIVRLKNFKEPEKLLTIDRKYILNPMMKIDSDDNIIVVFQKITEDRSIIEFNKIDPGGRIIMEHQVNPRGDGHLPRIEYVGDEYMICWNNIYGDKNEILSVYTRNKGKSWADIKSLTDNAFDDTGCDIKFFRDRFYCVWQDKRLGVWNISYAEFKKGDWYHFNRVTSGLISCWMPQIAFYRETGYITWIDTSEGRSVIYLKKEEINAIVFQETMELAKIQDVDFYRLKSTEDFILLSYLKKGRLFFTQLYSQTEKINAGVKQQDKKSYQVTWGSGRKDIVSFCINLSFQGSSEARVPVLNRDVNYFYLYAENESYLDRLFFSISYIDDIGARSGSSVTPVISGKTGRKTLIDWKDINNDSLFYDILNNEFYLTIEYNETMDLDDMINKIYFPLINYFTQKDNKFRTVFNLLNGNVDFSRLVKDDKIFMPSVWGEIFYFARVQDSIKNTLKKYESEFNLKNPEYAYYFLSSDLKQYKKEDQVRPGDYIIILR
ncbi:MAG: hypothetical protein JW827_08770 [Spirochaetes bacterium]|nr:hypothetical protein [Spirochaetota bacterium]